MTLISETATAVLLQSRGINLSSLMYDKVCIIEDIIIDLWNIKIKI